MIPDAVLCQGADNCQGKVRDDHKGSVRASDAFSMIEVMSSHARVSEAHVVAIEAQVSNICALSALVYVVVGFEALSIVLSEWR